MVLVKYCMLVFPLVWCRAGASLVMHGGAFGGGISSPHSWSLFHIQTPVCICYIPVHSCVHEYVQQQICTHRWMVSVYTMFTRWPGSEEVIMRTLALKKNMTADYLWFKNRPNRTWLIQSAPCWGAPICPSCIVYRLGGCKDWLGWWQMGVWTALQGFPTKSAAVKLAMKGKK